MITTRRVRPHRTPSFGRILAAALVLSALLAAAPPPAQALPLGGDGGPLARLLSWFEGLLVDLGFSRPESGGLEPAFLPEGPGGDPVGTPGTQGLTASVSEPQGPEKGIAARPSIR